MCCKSFVPGKKRKPINCECTHICVHAHTFEACLSHTLQTQVIWTVSTHCLYLNTFIQGIFSCGCYRSYQQKILQKHFLIPIHSMQSSFDFSADLLHCIFEFRHNFQKSGAALFVDFSPSSDQLILKAELLLRSYCQHRIKITGRKYYPVWSWTLFLP